MNSMGNLIQEQAEQNCIVQEIQTEGREGPDIIRDELLQCPCSTSLQGSWRCLRP